MKVQRLLLYVSAAAALLSLPAIAEDAADLLKTDKDRISYAVGVESARNFKKQGVEFDPQLFQRGMQDGLAGQKLLLPEKELRKVLQAFQSQVRQSMAANRKAQSDDNRKKAADFLATNRDKPGVVTLDSGLQYKVIKAGNGRKAVDSDTVQIEYRGTLLDGTQFDATESGHPASLRVSMVIPGWKEALKLMPIGAKWQLFVPPSLAYGERGVGNDVGPNELLQFDLDVLDIK
jgi:FKBP-type peptidyl-prolyl cis-trans isomerase FklB